MPASRATWYEYNRDAQAREERQRIVAEIVPVIDRVISLELTVRQQQVVGLYYREHRTQVEIAEALAISQPTVSQHLTGKRRGGKKIGGALRKIRKGIRRQADPLRTQRDRVDVLTVLGALLEAPDSRRAASEVLKWLL